MLSWIIIEIILSRSETDAAQLTIAHHVYFRSTCEEFLKLRVPLSTCCYFWTVFVECVDSCVSLTLDRLEVSANWSCMPFQAFIGSLSEEKPTR